MSIQIQLGDVIKHKDEPYRVVRIVRSQSLFEPDDGSPPYITDENYLELKGGDGDIDFLPLSSEKREYKGSASIIPALAPIPYGGE